MKKTKKIRRIVFLGLLELLLLLFFQCNVFAIDSKSEKAITPGSLKEWNDGPDVTKKKGGRADTYHVDVTADSTDLDEGYYSVYIYDYTKRYIKPYDGIRFHYTNKSNEELKINLTFTVNSKNSYTMEDNSFAILESEDSSNVKVVLTTYGTITIPAQFDGTVYVPFSKLYNEDGDKITASTIRSWGITTVMAENQKIEYSIGDIALLKGSVDAMKESHYQITLTGKEKIVIPNIGSIIEKYKADIIDMEDNKVDTEPIFYLPESIAGVSITSDGTLEIKSDCVASDIVVYAKTDKSINSGEINISLERASSVITDSGVPKADNVAKFTTAAYTKLNRAVVWIRIIIAAFILLLGVIFYTWFSQAKLNYQRIRKKLYQIFNELNDEEDEP